MKTRNFFLTLVALIAFAGNAWAQSWTASSVGAGEFYLYNVGAEAYVVPGNNWGTRASVNPIGGTLLTFSASGNGYKISTAPLFNNCYIGDNGYMDNGSACTWVFTAVTGETNVYKMSVNGNYLYVDAGATTTSVGNDPGTNYSKWKLVSKSNRITDLASATETNPKDATFLISCPNFDRNAVNTAWTIEAGNKNLSGGNDVNRCAESWRSTFTLTQTLSGLPNGYYQVRAQAALTDYDNVGNNYPYIYAAEQNVPFNLMVNGENSMSQLSDRFLNGEYWTQWTASTIVSNGSLNIGAKCTRNNTWSIWDNFQLRYLGPVNDLSAYEALLANAVAEANDLKGLIPTTAYNTIQAVVTANNQTYSTSADYVNAINAINDAISTYGNADMKARYAEFMSYKTTIQQLSNGQPSTTELTTFNNSISAATSDVENARTVAEVNDQISALHNAGMTYISTAEGQFDITFLASQTYTDWLNYYGNPAGLLADAFLTNRPANVPSFPEFWIAQADLTGKQVYQTVSNLPAGYYQVSMYAGALSTSGRDGFPTEATEGDANRTFAFAGDEADPSSIMRTGMPIKFATAVDFSELTVLDVNVHLTGTGNTNNLSFGVTKDLNGSNWHFAQIYSIVYSNQPDLTNLKATRDALVAEAEGLIASSGQYLTAEQQAALQSAITAGEAADDFESLNTVTLTTLPDAINTAKQQVAQAKASIPALHAALERFEQYYNLVDGTDYRRVTMSAKAWTDLLEKVDAATEALDDISQVAQYSSIAQSLNAQMDATDVSIRLFKSYKAMVEGCQSLNIAEGTTYSADTWMDTDEKETTAIGDLNAAFQAYSQTQYGEIDMAGFLGDNLDFSAAEGNQITQKIYDIVGWEEAYSDVTDPNTYLRNQDDANNGALAGQLYIRSNWGATSPTLTASKLKMLPVGKYKLSFSWNSNMSNFNNLSAYKLGESSTTIGETTSAAETLDYEFEVTENATPFDLVYGFTRTTTGNAAAQILVDDVTLVCIAGDEFKMAYEAAQNVDDNTAATAAAKSATTEYADNYASTADLNGFADAEARQAAINVLKNAKTIADNEGDATSLVANADLTNTTITDRAPAGWNVYYEGNDGGDIWVRTQDGAQVFNFWTGGINLVDMTQAIANLPKGAYRLSIDMGTDGFREDGSAPLFNFLNPSNMDIGASELVTTQNTAQNRAFATYTSAAEVGADHQATIGIRSEGNYFQMKNVKLEYIGDATEAATETDNAFVRQDFFWQDKGVESGSEMFLDNPDKYANASNVKVYPTGVNKIIHGLEGQFASSVPNADNGGTCSSLVITDGTSLSNTRAFTATAATYNRGMSNTWGTLILPYAVASDDNVQFYQLGSIVEGDDSWMNFEEVDNVAANTPVVYAKLDESATSVTMTGGGNVTTTDAAQGIDGTNLEGWSLEGVYAPTTLTSEQIDGTVYYVAQDKFWKATTDNGLTINPFRAYFHGTTGSSVKTFNVRVVDGDATRIIDLEHGIELGGDIYSVGGQLIRKNAQTLEGLPQGIYIVGGKKVVIR